jgi:hypothetical protein
MALLPVLTRRLRPADCRRLLPTRPPARRAGDGDPLSAPGGSRDALGGVLGLHYASGSILCAHPRLHSTHRPERVALAGRWPRGYAADDDTGGRQADACRRTRERPRVRGQRPRRFGWRLWDLTWTPSREAYHTIYARATDRAGNTQPFDQEWNPSGYSWNVIPRVGVNVVDRRSAEGTRPPVIAPAITRSRLPHALVIA